MPRNKDYQPIEIDVVRIRSLFHLPIEEAAKNCGICTTLLKRMCRRKGITRWPYRKLKSIIRMIRTLEQCEEEALDHKSLARLQRLREERDLIRAGKHEAVTGAFEPKRRTARPQSDAVMESWTNRPVSVSWQEGGAPHGIVVMHQEAGLHPNGVYAMPPPGQLFAVNQVNCNQQYFVAHPAYKGSPPSAYSLPDPFYGSPPSAKSHAAPAWHEARGLPAVRQHPNAPMPQYMPQPVYQEQSQARPVQPRIRRSVDGMDGAASLASLSNSPPRGSPPSDCLLPPLRSLLNQLDDR